MKQTVKDAASQASGKIAELGRKTVNQIDSTREPIASTLDKSASTLHETGDSAARAAHATAEKLESTARYVRQNDLQAMILRHVSPAFVEDPVRVLRVARFAARYHHLGFKLADETRTLMYTMVKNGELSHLVPERVWQEWHGSLQERNPEQFISTLRA